MRAAKHEGCSAFRANGNVHEQPLLEWIIKKTLGFLCDPALAEIPTELPAPQEFIDCDTWVMGRYFQILRLVFGDDACAPLAEKVEVMLRDLRTDLEKLEKARSKISPKWEAVGVEINPPEVLAAKCVLGEDPIFVMHLDDVRWWATPKCKLSDKEKRSRPAFLVLRNDDPRLEEEQKDSDFMITL